MNKKRIGALLIGATLLVGALGSFAYFTSKTSIGGRGNDGLLQQLEIQNGRVVITAEVANIGQALSDWTYDVAKLSTEEDDDNVVAFENRHRSPDINAETKESTEDKIERATIGSALPTEIYFTRPGDAIVLGTAESGTTDVGGLKITNNSNLTIKIRLKVKDLESAKTQLEAMNKAGWVLYINGNEIKLDKLEDGINLGIIAGGEEIDPVDIRFELPITAGNTYQEAIAAGGITESLNLNDLIEIQATQENNHDWEQIEQENYNFLTPLSENN